MANLIYTVITILMNKLLLIIVSALILLVPYKASAGGGRFDISTIDNDWYGTTGSGVELRARVTMPNDSSTLSIGEHAEYRIINPRAGDKCDTTDGFTDVNGYLHGNCSATTEGNYLVYIHSNDKGDDSSQVILYFYPPPTPTITPKPIPTATPKPISMTIPKPTTTPTINNTVTPTKRPTPMIQSANSNIPQPTPEVIAQQDSAALPSNYFIILISAILVTLLLVVTGILIMHMRRKRLSSKNMQLSPDNEAPRNFSPLLK